MPISCSNTHKTFMENVWEGHTYSERLPLSPTGNKAEALRLYSDPCPLYMLLHIPAEHKHAFSVSHTLF